MFKTGVCVLFISIFSIQLIYTHHTIGYTLEPSLEMFGLLVSILLLLLRLFFLLIPPISITEYAKLSSSFSTIIWDVYLITQISNTSLRVNILTVLVISFVRVLDIIITIKLRNSVRTKLPIRHRVRLFYLVLLLDICIVSLLYSSSHVVSGLANALWFSLLESAVHTSFALPLLFQSFFIPQSKELHLLAIHEVCSNTLLMAVHVLRCYFFFIRKDIFLIHSIPPCFLTFIKFIQSLTALPAIWRVSSLRETKLAEPEICVICQTQTQDAVVLSCNHKFHKNCITDWFVRSDRCPICQKPIKVVQSVSEDEMIQNWIVREV
ncbi:hypothetical protein EIN_377170 [Entamoeba invadens IP1]|uniref:RING-type domain-containing protein n=1 Tax=Entamoeba invadens IP1 TaxID=370355 RepID=A0A0A1TU67_ENTIV|nr:hypothetical protein EIN_377170 [Entamoeba invadens IP1]ELP83492.1 hypothetical protein EIN_377170 [Entamoeba invadens IP1]|eukprot:XP_004182838.1 hypothetical protein EIN_377170 [Entamoeba invadens IP1]